MSSTPALMEAPHDKDLVASLEPFRREIQLEVTVIPIESISEWKTLSPVQCHGVQDGKRVWIEWQSYSSWYA